MNFNVNNNVSAQNYNSNIQNTEIAKKEENTPKPQTNINDAIDAFTNDTNLENMLAVLNELQAKNVTTGYENEKLTLSFELNGKNYIIQARNQND